MAKSRHGRCVAIVLLTALVAVASAVLPSPAAAARSACGKAVIADWFDNEQIDGVYDLPCYGEALDGLPPEIVDYTSAKDVISRAFQKESHGRQLTIRNRDSNKADPPPQTAPAVDTSAPAEAPIPLLILASLALILLVAGGSGYVMRRRRGWDAD